MRPGSIFVHCGSGATVDEAAMLAALRVGHLAGAALDTYTYEPLRPDDPLVDAVQDPALNLILTPHTAAGGVTAGGSGSTQDYDNILALLEGRALRYQIA